ncbi:MAG: hypothetical protein J5913_05755 [Prevotella sp.]|nr:hypothetical protein [Prevotella sp.]
MKKVNLWMLVAILTCGLMLVSCFSNDDNVSGTEVQPTVPAQELPDYTVIFYSTGGGNLDPAIQNDFVSLCNSLGTDNKKVRVLVQYKYSKVLREDVCGKPGHLYRMELTSDLLNDTTGTDKHILKLTDDMLYGTQQAAAELYQPDSIANFIKYCTEVAPARNYVFMMSDHGAGYQIEFDYDKSKVTRAMMSDDNLDGNPIMTNHELREGIQKSGVHMKIINFDCCLMNNLETLAELQGITDYVIAAGHTTIGQDQGALIKMLENAGPNAENLKEWGQKFVDGCADMTAKARENEIGTSDARAKNVDFNITDMSKFGNVLTTLKDCTDFLMAVWDDISQDKDAVAAFENKLFDPNNNCYQYYPQAALYDAGDYMKLLSEEPLKDVQDASGMTFAPLYKAFYDACKAAIICHAQSITSYGMESRDLTYSITLGCKGFIGTQYDNTSQEYPAIILGLDLNGNPAQLTVWNDEIEPYTPTSDEAKAYYANHQQAFAWANSYCETTFDQIVGWSRWLKVNPVYSYNNPPYDNRADNLGIAISNYSGLMQTSIQFSKETLKYFNIRYIRNSTKGNSYGPMISFYKGIQQNHATWPAKEDVTIWLERRESSTGPWEIKVSHGLMEVLALDPLTDKVVKRSNYEFTTSLTGTTEAEADEAASKFYFRGVSSLAFDGETGFQLYDANGNEVDEWPFLNYVKSKNQ